MKNIIKTVALIAAASVAFLACNKEAPSKAAVEGGFTPLPEVPTVTIDLENYSFDNVKGIASVSLTVSGLAEGADSLTKVGFIATTDSTWKTTKFFPVDATTDGTYTFDSVTVLAGKKNLVQACVATLAGTSFSEVLELNVPDIEWYKKLPKTYYAHLADYWDDEYDSTIQVSFDPATNEVTFMDFEPWNKSMGRSLYTIGIADIADLENPTVNFELDPVQGTFLIADDNGAVDYYQFLAVPMDEEDDFANATSYTIKFNKDMTEMYVQAWGLYSVAAGGWYEIFPDVTYNAL